MQKIRLRYSHGTCKQKQFPRLSLSHILLLVFVDSETLDKLKKVLPHFSIFFQLQICLTLAAIVNKQDTETINDDQ